MSTTICTHGARCSFVHLCAHRQGPVLALPQGLTHLHLTPFVTEVMILNSKRKLRTSPEPIKSLMYFAMCSDPCFFLLVASTTICTHGTRCTPVHRCAHHQGLVLVLPQGLIHLHLTPFIVVIEELPRSVSNAPRLNLASR